MKNPKFVVLFALLFGTLSLFGQDVKLKLSNEIKIERQKNLSGLLHHDESGYYMTFETPQTVLRNREYSIAKYDNSFKEKYIKTYKIKDRNVVSHGFTFLKDKFVWIQSDLDRRKRELTYYAVTISLDGKASKPKRMLKVKYDRIGRLPQLDWKISNDSTKMVMIVEFDTDIRREEYQSNFVLFDSDLNTVWKKRVKLKDSQLQVDRQSFELANNDEVYITARIFDSNSGASGLGQLLSSKPQYDNYFIRINSEGHKKFKLNLKDKFIKGFKLEESESDNSVVCVAMTSNTRNGPILGMSYFRIDAENGGITYAKNRSFSDEEIEKFGRRNTSRDRKSKERGLDDTFTFKEIISQPDGSFLIIAEEFIVDVTEFTDRYGVSTFNTKFKNNHIVIAKANPEGEIQNIDIIPKKYSATKSGRPVDPIYEERTHYMFYSSLRGKDKTYFLYNDDEKNFRKNERSIDRYRVLTNFNESVAVIAHIDDNGDLVRKELFKREDTETLLMPKFSVEISETELFVFLKRRRLLGKNVFKFGVLEIE